MDRKEEPSILPVLFFFIGGPVLIVAGCYYSGTHSESVRTPTVIIESTTVNAYNIDSENHVDSYIISITARVYNSLAFHSLEIQGTDRLVRVAPGRTRRVEVWQTVDARAMKVTGSRARGGLVDVFLYGPLVIWPQLVIPVSDGHFAAMCNNVAVNFDLHKERSQKLYCKVKVVQR